MRRLLYYSFFLASIISFNENVYADDTVTTEIRTVGAFNKIELQSNNEVDIITGRPQSLSVSADSTTLSKVITQVKGDTLQIKNDDKVAGVFAFLKNLFVNTDNINNLSRATVKISMPQLASIKASGANKINIQDQDSGQNKIKFNFSGAIEGQYQGRPKHISLESSGDTHYNLIGSADQLQILSSGAGKIDAEKLNAEKVNIEASGATAIVVKALNEINIETSGASNIEVFGHPKHVTQENSGTSTITIK